MNDFLHCLWCICETLISVAGMSIISGAHFVVYLLYQGLVAFSENGLMIRWWSLGTAWWERISRISLVPVQCTKLIFVPPWEGFSPNSSRLSIMASIIGNERQVNSRVAHLSTFLFFSSNVLLHII